VVVVDLGGGLAVVGAQDAPGVLQEAALVGDGRGEEQGVQWRAVEPFPGVRAGSPASSGGPPGRRVSRARAAARVFAPMPPRRITGSCPSARRALAIFSRWPVRLVRTRQFLSWARATVTSAMICWLRASLAMRSL